MLDEVVQTDLRDGFVNPAFTTGYLDAAAQYAVLEGGDSESLRQAISDVAQARGTEVGSVDDLTSIVDALRTLGFRLGVTPLTDEDLRYIESSRDIQTEERPAP